MGSPPPLYWGGGDAVAYSCTMLAAAALQPLLLHQGMIDLQMEIGGMALTRLLYCFLDIGCDIITFHYPFCWQKFSGMHCNSSIWLLSCIAALQNCLKV